MATLQSPPPTSRWQRQRAKFWFRISGWLSHIKTPQRYLRLDSNGVVLQERWEHGLPGHLHWAWGSCELGLKILGWSIRLDPYHWDHWALEYGPNVTDCPECGGKLEGSDAQGPADISPGSGLD